MPELGEVVVLERLREEQLEHRRARPRRSARDARPPARATCRAWNQRISTLECGSRDVEADDGHEQPERVRERQRGQRADDPRDVARVVAGLAGEPEVLVREHHALRPAGRAARVHQRGEVGARRRDDRRGLGLLELGEAVGGDDLDVARGLAGGVRQLRAREDEPRARVRDDVRELGRRQQEDRRCHDGPDAPDRVVGDADLGAVRHQHDDAVARLDAQLAQSACEPRRPAQQLGGPVPLRPRTRARRGRRAAPTPPRRPRAPDCWRALRQAASSVRPPAPSQRAFRSGAAPSGKRSRSAPSSSSASQRPSATKASPASQGRSTLTTPPQTKKHWPVISCASSAEQRDHERRHVGGVERVEAVLGPGQLAEGLLGHPRPRVRRQAVDRDAVAAELLGGDQRQPGDPGFGGPVVGLADVAEDPRRARGVDHAAAHLLARLRALAPMRPGVPERSEVALQVHRDHGVPLLLRHVHEHAVAEDPRVVHEDVEPAVAVDRPLHELLGRAEVGHVRVARHRLAAVGHDLVDDLLGRACVLALSCERAPQVVDDDPRARPRQSERVVTPDAAPGAGHDRHLPLERRHAERSYDDMGFEGGQIQTSIYVAGESPWPIAPEEWEARAAEALEPGPFDYIAGGAGSESTMAANREAFERHRLVPRMLRGNRERDLSVDVVGTSSPAPFLLAPVGVLSIAHEDGELAVARASAATGVPLILSSAASHSIEEVAEAMGDARALVPALLGQRPRGRGQPGRASGGIRASRRSSSPSTRRCSAGASATCARPTFRS